MKTERVIVTGAAGFIGSNISKSLLNQGYVVVGIDDLSTGRKENLADIEDFDTFEFHKCDINHLDQLIELMDRGDYVIHQAALPSVPKSVADPISSNHANIDGTLTTLVAARDSGIKKFVFASSSAVYGDSPILPKREDMVPEPLTPYALNKLTGELYCDLFTKLYGLKTICLRYFNVFGPKQDPGSEYAAVIPKFITAVMNDTPPTIFGDGLQTRDFAFVEDVATANITAMKSEANGVYNIAGGRGVTLLELAEIVNNIFGKDLRPVFKDTRAGDIKHSVADVKKAKECLGFELQYSLEQGLEKTVEYFSKK